VRDTVSLFLVGIKPRVEFLDHFVTALDDVGEGVAYEIVSPVQTLARAWESCGFSSCLKETRYVVCISVIHN